jgi:hypothetical protein
MSKIAIDSPYLDLKNMFESDERDLATQVLEDAGIDAYDDTGVRKLARTALAQDDEDDTAPIPGGGELLEESDAGKIYKTIDRAVMSQERLAKNRDEKGKHFDRLRNGCQFSILEKSEDQSVYQAILPPGVDDIPQPIPNKVLDLSRK